MLFRKSLKHIETIEKKKKHFLETSNESTIDIEKIKKEIDHEIQQLDKIIRQISSRSIFI